MSRKLVILALIIALVAPSVFAAGQQIQENDGNPFVLLAAGAAAGVVTQDPHASSLAKFRARRMYRDVAYRYALANGLKPKPAFSLAKSLANGTPIKMLICDDFAVLPSDCAPVTVMDCTESRVRIPSGAASDLPCTPTPRTGGIMVYSLAPR